MRLLIVLIAAVSAAMTVVGSTSRSYDPEAFFLEDPATPIDVCGIQCAKGSCSQNCPGSTLCGAYCTPEGIPICQCK